LKGFKKDGKFRPTGNRKKSSITKDDVKKKNKFGQSAEAIENQHSIAIKRNKTTWEAKLEEPIMEEGTTTHTFDLGDKATEHEVKNALMRMTLPDGSFRYHEQDVNPPYLHYIKKTSENVPKKVVNPNPTAKIGTTKMEKLLESMVTREDGGEYQTVVAGTYNEFHGYEPEQNPESEGLWICGECIQVFMGVEAFNFHRYEQGVEPRLLKIIEDHGWHPEWYDNGTLMLFQS
jgi:hypothetical protein